MSKSTIAKGMLVAAAGAIALGAGVAAPHAASAQPYAGGGYYDPCGRDQAQRGIMGALIGGAIGATVGSQAAANHHRTDGSLLGGGLGAVAGAVIGNKSAACTSGRTPYPPPPAVAPPPPPQAYYEEPPPPPPPPYPYGARFEEDDHWVYGRHGERFRVAERPPGPDGCTLAESPIYMPDGRVQKRFVRVCLDRAGHYQVVE